MAVGIFSTSKVIVQGITGKEGSFHTHWCREYGTRIVAGVTPGKEGSMVDDIPVYDSVKKAVHLHGADSSLIFVPPVYASDAMLESIYAGLGTIICITEGIPVHDMMKVKRVADTYRATIIGPNCPGIISPGAAKAGIMPAAFFKKGTIGVISRSGTLLYEAADQIARAGMGISTALGIGGDPITGTNYRYWLDQFEHDPETEAVLIIGEIGGTQEETAADYIKTSITKPVSAFIAGHSAPIGKRMGHAGAIIQGNRGTAESKEQAFQSAGVTVINYLNDIGRMVQQSIRSRSSHA
ncbi:MAG: succinate--CoA ligase subunit alpha [Candidatus Delongbacteria bacterium]|nr:succinate--CoA ligase subunit alpha [Candidatus Delongbacteria bacterium]